MGDDGLPVAHMIDDARRVLGILANYGPINRDDVGDLACHVLALAGDRLRPIPGAIDGEPVPRIDVREDQYGRQQGEWLDVQGTAYRVTADPAEARSWLWLATDDDAADDMLGFSRAECEALWPLLRRFAETGRLAPAPSAAAKGGGA